MARGAWGALAGGLGQGMMMGQDAKDREAARALDERRIAALETQAANPAPAFPDWAPPPSYTPGAGGTEQPALSYGGARGAVPGGTGYTGSDPTFWGLLAKWEGAGNFSTLFGHSQKEGGKFAGVDVSKMTLAQLWDFQRPDGEYGQWVKSELARTGQTPRVATPAGAAQIVGTTGKSAAKAMGLSPDTPFNEDTQRRMAVYLAQQRLSRANSIEGKRAGLRAEWEGFKHVSNSDLDRVIQELEG